MAGEYLDFSVISKIPFKELWDKLNITYEEVNGNLKSKYGIASIEKNLYINPNNKAERGSVINFYASLNKCSLREAAAELKKTFLDKPVEEPKKEVPEYELDFNIWLEKRGFTQGVCQDLEFGYAKQGMLRGAIAFKILDAQGNKAGYISYKFQSDYDDKWFYPKAFQVGAHLYNLHRQKSAYCILVPSALDAARVYQFGIDKVVGMLNPQLTDTQVTLLQRFNTILVLHPNPEYIVKKLSRFAFVKAPDISKPVWEMTKEELEGYI